MAAVRIALQFSVRRAAIEFYNGAFGAIECIAWGGTDDNPEAVADGASTARPAWDAPWWLGTKRALWCRLRRSS
jgi:hypothetical protein